MSPIQANTQHPVQLEKASAESAPESTGIIKPMRVAEHIRILGIDPGLATVGFGLVTMDFKSDQVVNQQWGVISTSKHLPDACRLQEIYHDMIALLAQFEPDVISLEKIFFFKNAKTLVPVSQARGVLLLAMRQMNIPVFEYTPMQVKQAITGYGKASKSEIQDMMMQLLTLPERPKPDDAADALAMALCHYQFHGRLEKHAHFT